MPPRKRPPWPLPCKGSKARGSRIMASSKPQATSGFACAHGSPRCSRRRSRPACTSIMETRESSGRSRQIDASHPWPVGAAASRPKGPSSAPSQCSKSSCNAMQSPSFAMAKACNRYAYRRCSVRRSGTPSKCFATPAMSSSRLALKFVGKAACKPAPWLKTSASVTSEPPPPKAGQNAETGVLKASSAVCTPNGLPGCAEMRRNVRNKASAATPGVAPNKGKRVRPSTGLASVVDKAPTATSHPKASPWSTATCAPTIRCACSNSSSRNLTRASRLTVSGALSMLREVQCLGESTVGRRRCAAERPVKRGSRPARLSQREPSCNASRAWRDKICSTGMPWASAAQQRPRRIWSMRMKDTTHFGNSSRK
mmetsp:Transcript_97829/g.282250  ORF Transcript_97829/g.282250 Transcript_97829/m.282250 type:complete len:369 (-) Transcript_97829:1514-2620(-)